MPAGMGYGPEYDARVAALDPTVLDALTARRSFPQEHRLPRNAGQVATPTPVAAASPPAAVVSAAASTPGVTAPPIAPAGNVRDFMLDARGATQFWKTLTPDEQRSLASQYMNNTRHGGQINALVNQAGASDHVAANLLRNYGRGEPAPDVNAELDAQIDAADGAADGAVTQPTPSGDVSVELVDEEDRIFDEVEEENDIIGGGLPPVRRGATPPTTLRRQDGTTLKLEGNTADLAAATGDYKRVENNPPLEGEVIPRSDTLRTDPDLLDVDPLTGELRPEASLPPARPQLHGPEALEDELSARVDAEDAVASRTDPFDEPFPNQDPNAGGRGSFIDTNGNVYQAIPAGPNGTTVFIDMRRGHAYDSATGQEIVGDARAELLSRFPPDSDLGRILHRLGSPAAAAAEGVGTAVRVLK